MKNMTLLVMAAGMGSRYGGLKQLDEVGPGRETIIDYSVFDAIKAGFSKVVFIIRKDFEDEFKSKISNKFSNDIQVEFVFQDIHLLPNGYSAPKERIKPWGTGHAILCASNVIDGPFNDFIGTVSDIDMDRTKVRVMVSFFGRETPVELDFLQVEKA